MEEPVQPIEDWEKPMTCPVDPDLLEACEACQ